MNLLFAVFCSHCFFYLDPGFHFYSPDVDECVRCPVACGTLLNQGLARVPALAGVFLTPEPPGRRVHFCLL